MAPKRPEMGPTKGMTDLHRRKATDWRGIFRRTGPLGRPARAVLLFKKNTHTGQTGSNTPMGLKARRICLISIRFSLVAYFVSYSFKESSLLDPGEEAHEYANLESMILAEGILIFWWRSLHWSRIR